jgi:hypothetical protein
MRERFDGYNRDDYHYARTSREAFGHSVSKEDFDLYEHNHKWDTVVGVAGILIAILFVCIVW